MRRRAPSFIFSINVMALAVSEAIPPKAILI